MSESPAGGRVGMQPLNPRSGVTRKNVVRRRLSLSLFIVTDGYYDQSPPLFKQLRVISGIFAVSTINNSNVSPNSCIYFTCSSARWIRREQPAGGIYVRKCPEAQKPRWFLDFIALTWCVRWNISQICSHVHLGKSRYKTGKEERPSKNLKGD